MYSKFSQLVRASYEPATDVSWGDGTNTKTRRAASSILSLDFESIDDAVRQRRRESLCSCAMRGSLPRLGSVTVTISPFCAALPWVDTHLTQRYIVSPFLILLSMSPTTTGKFSAIMSWTRLTCGAKTRADTYGQGKECRRSVYSTTAETQKGNWPGQLYQCSSG